MTVEQTKKEHNKLSEKTVTKLTEFNPIDKPVEINNNIITNAKIVSINAPDIKYLLSHDIPTIQLKLKHDKISELLTIDILIDAFIDSNEYIDTDYILLSELLFHFNIHVQNLHKLKNKNIPIHIKRYNNTSYKAIPQLKKMHNSNIDLWDINNSDIKNNEYKDLYLLRKAQSYGKARIVELIDKNKYIKVGFEIPFCNEIQYINFSKNKNGDNIMFSSLVEYIIGRQPISQEEYSAIIDKEIKVQYKGGFDIEQDVKNKLKEFDYTFLQFIDYNKKTTVNLFLYYTGLFTLLYSLTPLAMIPIYIANKSNSLIALLLIISLCIVSYFTLSNMHTKYETQNNER